MAYDCYQLSNQIPSQNIFPPFVTSLIASRMYYQNWILSILLFINDQFFPSLAQVESMSINIDLIHMDSLQSYNRSIASSQLFAGDVQRSRARVNRSNMSFSYTHEKVAYQVELKDGRRKYHLRSFIGGKKVELLALFDMTTDFIWTTCEGPVYYASQSRTHYKVRLKDEACQLNPFRDVDASSIDDCRYKYDVPKTTLATSGFVVNDHFLFDFHAQRGCTLTFGCADTGLLGGAKVAVVGFGKGNISLPHQVKHRFSYCLQSPSTQSTSSVLKLGALPPSLEDLMVRSPLHENSGDPSSYYLNLNGINIGGSDLQIPSPHLIKIDVGSALTVLEDSLFQNVKEKVKQIITTTTQTQDSEYILCYKTDDLRDIALPSMTFHFDQASFNIQSERLFHENVDKRETCMSIVSVKMEHSGTETSIFGSIAQERHIMQFDYRGNEVSFTSNAVDCHIF